MWYKCVSKYCICDNTIVNIKDSFTMAEMSHIQYLHTHLHHIKMSNCMINHKGHVQIQRLSVVSLGGTGT